MARCATWPATGCPPATPPLHPVWLSSPRLFGDIDGNGTVTASDLSAIQASLGSTSSSANYRWYMDFDNDRDVDSLGLLPSQRQTESIGLAPHIWTLFQDLSWAAPAHERSWNSTKKKDARLSVLRSRSLADVKIRRG